MYELKLHMYFYFYFYINNYKKLQASPMKFISRLKFVHTVPNTLLFVHFSLHDYYIFGKLK